MSRIIRLPIIAIGRDIIQIHRSRNTAQLLKELHAQALAHVPRDVAVEQPGARVARHEGDHQPAPGRQHGAVAPGRVGGYQLGLVGSWVVGSERVARRYWVGERG
jgi:hypothetical protein